MPDYDLQSLLIYVAIAAALAAASSVAGMVGWWLKRQGVRIFGIFSAVESLTDSTCGISTVMQEEFSNLRLQMDENNQRSCKGIDELHTSVEQLRTNGHMFADRVKSIEDRVQQGAVELNDLRKKVDRNA